MCILLVLLLSQLLSACTQELALVKPVRISRQVDFELMHPKSFGQSLSIVQSLEVIYKGETQQLLAQLEITPLKMTLVGMSPMGNRLFTVIWNGRSLHDKHLSQWPLPFEPKHILADVQLALWNDISSQKELTIVEDNSTKMTRMIHGNGKALMRIKYNTRPFWHGKILVEHLERNYKLKIQTIQINSKP